MHPDSPSDLSGTATAEAKPSYVYSILKPHGQSFRRQVRLLLSEAKLNELWHRGGRLAGLDEGNRHRLRHGGASMDGLDPSISDITIQNRGFWLDRRSVQRYRKPGAYLRELAKLDQSQLAAVERQEHLLPTKLTVKLRSL